mgnify:CR=1 FL=1
MSRTGYPRLDRYGVGYYPYGHAFLTGVNKFVFDLGKLPLNLGAEVEVIGDVPNKACVIVCKHEKYLDTIVQHYLLGGHHLHQLARHDFFDKWYEAWFFTWSGCLPIDRFNENRRLNYEALNYAADRLAADEPVLVYPEKHRHPGHIGHLYVESLIYLDKLARDRGLHVPLVAASQYYEDNHVGIPSLINPFEGKTRIRIAFDDKSYLDGLSAEDITERFVTAYQKNLPGHEYRDDKFDECKENPIK